MRTVQEIKKAITDDFIANSTIREKYKLEEGDTFESRFSKVSIENILFFVVASAIYIVEALCYDMLDKTQNYIANERVNSVQWYRTKILNFILGAAYDEDSQTFDTTGWTEEEIEAAKIVKQCAVEEAYFTRQISETETEEVYGVVIKLATTNADGDLAPLSVEQFKAVRAYINLIKCAGINIDVINSEPDSFGGLLYLWVNPTIIYNKDGLAPVYAQIEDYFKNIAFNGEIDLNELEKHLKLVDGVTTANFDGLHISQGGSPGSYPCYGIYRDSSSEIGISAYFIRGISKSKGGYYQFFTKTSDLAKYYNIPDEHLHSYILKIEAYSALNPSELLFSDLIEN